MLLKLWEESHSIFSIPSGDCRNIDHATIVRSFDFVAIYGAEKLCIHVLALDPAVFWDKIALD